MKEARHFLGEIKGARNRFWCSTFGTLDAFQSLVMTVSAVALNFVQTVAPKKETRSNDLANADLETTKEFLRTLWIGGDTRQ